ncbi:MAG: endolytic transglycosylase MltG [Candidatus Portnoybacteria bacterium]|nr:endolytic transglycosylase MltG [Candidatus Portnoybacteria bacterium]
MNIISSNAKGFFLGVLSAAALFLAFGALWIGDELSQAVFTPAGFFKINKGDTLREVALSLSKEGVIDNPLLLLWYGEITGRGRLIRSGVYEISSALKVKELLELFEKGSNVRFRLTLPEGITLKKSLERMREAGFSVEEEFFLNPPRYLSARYQFLSDLPEGQSLEGFLFPDSYLFDPDQTSEKIAVALLDAFNQKFKPEWYEAIQRQGQTVRETVIIASILEKEVPTLKEKKIVSGILWKRLALGMPLQLDATVNYATGKSLAAVTYEDLKTDSPYNTYKYQGLPPGPISNPGEESLEAAVFPEPSEYWFYLSRQDTGQTIFSKTYRQHTLAKARYLR